FAPPGLRVYAAAGIAAAASLARLRERGRRRSGLQQFPRVQLQSLESAPRRLVDEVRGAAGTIGITVGVVERDKRETACIGRNGVEHHPKIVPLPDIIVLLIDEPARQLLGLR